MNDRPSFVENTAREAAIRSEGQSPTLLQKDHLAELPESGPTGITPEPHLPFIAGNVGKTVLRELDRIPGHDRPCSDTPGPLRNMVGHSSECCKWSPLQRVPDRALTDGQPAPRPAVKAEIVRFLGPMPNFQAPRQPSVPITIRPPAISTWAVASLVDLLPDRSLLDYSRLKFYEEGPLWCHLWYFLDLQLRWKLG